MALSVGSDQPRPPADSSGSQLCPSSAPGPALEGGGMHSSWSREETCIQVGSSRGLDAKESTLPGRPGLHPEPGLNHFSLGRMLGAAKC